MDARLQKSILRMQMRLRLRTLSRKQILMCESTVVRQILREKIVQEAQNVFVYVSYGREVPTHQLIQSLLQLGKSVYIPYITADCAMHAVRLRNFSQLRRGRYGIPTSMTKEVFTGEIDFAIVPGLAFDLAGNRFGKGGGYYDRFFAMHRVDYAMGIAWNQQIVQDIPVEKHDQRMDHVLTFSSTDFPSNSPQIP